MNLFILGVPYDQKYTPNHGCSQGILTLVYFEVTNRVEEAIAEEKRIKGGSRQKKIDLVNSMNSEWKDSFGEYFSHHQSEENV